LVALGLSILFAKNCGKCQAYSDGDIKKNAMELRQLLGSFDGYAERLSNFLPVFKNYPVQGTARAVRAGKLSGVPERRLQVSALRGRPLL